MLRHFGHPFDVRPGVEFANRIELSLAGVHRPRIAGISGSQREGCDSIVVCNGYEDDIDEWDRIVYTGAGGRDPKSGKQVSDQEMIGKNLALRLSCERKLPVRVSRGPLHGSPYAPDRGYRYDGLYYVHRYWREQGRRGFWIWRFELRRAQPAN